MGEKLVKINNEFYSLYDSDGDIVASNNPKTPTTKKLSSKNCQAIERGYDLDELTNRAFDNMGYHSTVTPHEEKQFKLGYRVAFREAIEILGDKKYTETDLYKAFLINSAGNNTTLRNFFEQTVLPMIHHNEWDVEICCYIGNGDDESDSFKDPLVTNTGIPKLDNNGCLILKRK
jgi:hypothetical protein